MFLSRHFCWELGRSPAEFGVARLRLNDANKTLDCFFFFREVTFAISLLHLDEIESAHFSVQKPSFTSFLPLVMSRHRLTISVATEDQMVLLQWKNPVQFTFTGDPSSSKAKAILSILASNSWSNHVELISSIFEIADKHLQTFKQDSRLGPSSKIETHLFSILDDDSNEETISSVVVSNSDVVQDEDTSLGPQKTFSTTSITFLDPVDGTYNLLENVLGGRTRGWLIENGSLTIDECDGEPASIFIFEKLWGSNSFKFVNATNFCTISCRISHWYAHIYTTKDDLNGGRQVINISGHYLGLPHVQ